MNYLAHFHLAWPDDNMILGGLEGDFHKGPLDTNPSPLAAGIALHRRIDAFTDQHPRVAQLRSHFPEHLRRYAGIVTDLCFDHQLCRHWDDFHAEPHHEFTAAMYALLEKESSRLSSEAAQMAKRICQYDLLAVYRDWDHVARGAQRIGERLKRGNPFTELPTELAPLKQETEIAFLEFYPDLMRFAADSSSDIL